MITQEDYDKAQEELSSRSYDQILEEAARSWGAKALVAYDMVDHEMSRDNVLSAVAFLRQGDEFYNKALEFASQAGEHAPRIIQDLINQVGSAKEESEGYFVMSEDSEEVLEEAQGLAEEEAKNEDSKDE